MARLTNNRTVIVMATCIYKRFSITIYISFIQHRFNKEVMEMIEGGQVDLKEK